MDSKRRAELLTVRVRWAVLAGACVMLGGHAPVVLIGVVGAVVAAYNLLLWRSCRSNESYARLGQKLGHVARALDVAVISITLAAPQGIAGSTYLLYVVVLVQAGYVDVRRRVLAGLTGASVLAFLVISLVQAPNTFVTLQAFGRAAVIGLGGVVGLYIGVSRRQDDTGRDREQRFATLFDWSMRFISGEHLNKVLSHILRTAVQEVGATSGYIMVSSPEDPEELVTEVAYSNEADYEFPHTCRIGEGLAGYVASTGQPMLVNAADVEGRPWDAEGTVTDNTSAICVPLLNRQGAVDPSTKRQHEVLGCISMLSADSLHTFSEDDLDLVRMLASLMSMATANARMYEDMRNTFLRTLETLANSLEARDEYTRGHSQRVCDVSLMIGREMGVCDEALEEMRVGTQLHDIGKIGIPDAVLNKPGRLTEEEFILMRQHPIIGWEICRPLGLNEGALMLIRNHHERLDGTGYPDSLKGGELPLSVRIVCVADAFDAMSSRRPYRDVMDEKLRLEQFNRFAGSQFDPVVVQVLKTLLREGRLDEMYEAHWADVKRHRDETLKAKAA
jgi:HD-GYP domain-containing protein (c-di-GMP phosphodiesterase class II)